MEKDNIETEKDSVDETVNYKDGFSFDFTDAGHNISVHCSSISGKESVFVDDNLVCEKRSFRRKSSMEFMLSDDKYEVEFNVVDMLKGETHCTLIKNDVHVKTIKKALLMKNQLTGKSAGLIISLLFIFGGISGYVLMRYLLMVFGG